MVQIKLYVVVDKNVRPLYQRQGRTTNSLHYFHVYAVKNRISDDCPDSLEFSFTNPKELLDDFEILIKGTHVHI